MHPALDALRDGQIILLYDADGREEETDMVVASQAITPDVVRTMRQDAGGLLCTALAPRVHRALGLPFLTDVVQEAASTNPVLKGLLPNDIQYDGSKPAFGLTINHRDTYTGITDADRALTISRLAELASDVDVLGEEAARERLAAEFRSPGHCILLNGADGGLAARQGHTELSLALAEAAGITGSTTVCEMLDPLNGQALKRQDAEAYAKKHGLVFLTGEDVVRMCPVPTSV